jgi:hypothetical protein
MKKGNKLFDPKEYQIKVQTDPGSAMWASLSSPKKWADDENGNYQISIILSQKEAQPIIDDCVGLREKLTDICEGPNFKLSPYDPWKVTDDGNIELRWKKPFFPAGKLPATPPVPTYLQDGEKIDWDTVDYAVGNGSIVRLGGYIRPYYVPMLGLGIQLRLAAVKVLKLEKYIAGEASGDFSDFGDSSDSDDALAEAGADSVDF